MTDTQNTQDHALDETTGVDPQHFDGEGYVVGHPHHTTVAADDLTPEGRLIETDEGIESDEAAETTADPARPDGQFDDQRMPTTDGELSDPDAAPASDPRDRSL